MTLSTNNLQKHTQQRLQLNTKSLDSTRHLWLETWTLAFVYSDQLILPIASDSSHVNLRPTILYTGWYQSKDYTKHDIMKVSNKLQYDIW